MAEQEGLFDNPEEDLNVILAGIKPTRTADDIVEAEAQVAENIRDVRYIVREYPVEVIVQKYLMGRSKGYNEMYVPDYQRDFVWPERNQSRFIESLLIGLPVPFLFVADVADAEGDDKAGRLEIVDGVQRIRTLTRFLTNDLVLKDLDRLTRLNGFRFSGNVDARLIRELGEKYGFSTQTKTSITRDGHDLYTIKNNRNDLAHGLKTFEDVGRDYTTMDLFAISRRAMHYVSGVLNNIADYLDTDGYVS